MVRQLEEPAPQVLHFLHQVPAKPTVSTTRQVSIPGPDTLHQKQVRSVSLHLLVNFQNSKQTVVCFNVRFINIAALDKYPIVVSELGTDYNRPLDIGHSTRLPTRAGVHTSTVISTPRVAFESSGVQFNREGNREVEARLGGSVWQH